MTWMAIEDRPRHWRNGETGQLVVLAASMDDTAEQAAIVAAEAAAAAETAPTDAERAAAVTLSRAEFFDRWRAAVALQSGEPRILEWTITQIEASALPEAAKALYAERVETAVFFPRIDPELGDVMATLGAVFGLSSAEVDDLFLGRSVAIARADCPITGVVQSLSARIASLEGAS